MDHRQYSPELDLSAFWFFDYIKQRLDDHQNAEGLSPQIAEIVVIPRVKRNGFLNAFQKNIF